MSEKNRRQGSRKMLYLVEKWQKDNQDAAIDPDLVARWTLEGRHYNLPPSDPQNILRRMIARALREHHIEDPQGRGVRKFHTVVTEDMEGRRTSTSYAIYDAPPDHMRLSVALRRRSALRDVIQLQLDLDSYNENNKFGEKIPDPEYNFNPDVLENKMPTDYPADAPPGYSFEEDIELDDDEDEEEEGTE